MKSSLSADSNKEDRQVRFAGLDWSKEEARSKSGHLRRKERKKEERGRRRARRLKEEQERLQQKMESAEDARAFLEAVVDNDDDDKFFQLDNAGVILELSKRYATSSTSNTQLINELLKNWGEIVENDGALSTIRDWMRKAVDAKFYNPNDDDDDDDSSSSNNNQNNNNVLQNHPHKPPLIPKNPSHDSNDSSLACSVDAQVPPIADGVKKSIEAALRYLDVEVVLRARNNLNMANTSQKTNDCDNCVDVLRGLLFSALHANNHSDDLKSSLTAFNNWVSSPTMLVKEKVFLLAPVFNEFVAKFKSASVDEALSPVKKNPQSN